MIKHINLGNKPFTRFRALQALIAKGEITLAGNANNKIYGTLHCASGKRMKTEHRVFFAGEQEAIAMRYRPCGHCLPDAYKTWKQQNGPI